MRDLSKRERTLLDVLVVAMLAAAILAGALVLGGATKEILDASSMPILMSH